MQLPPKVKLAEVLLPDMQKGSMFCRSFLEMYQAQISDILQWVGVNKKSNSIQEKKEMKKAKKFVWPPQIPQQC